MKSWEIGQRVGVGFFGGEDGECEPCRRGDFVNCLKPVIPGITTDGGYAEVMIAESRALVAIPEELSSTDALRSSAQVSRRITLYGMPGFAPEIPSLFRVLAGSVISEFSLPGVWGSE